MSLKRMNICSNVRFVQATSNKYLVAKLIAVIAAINLAVRACEDEDQIEFMLNVIKSLKLQVFAPTAARSRRSL
jgi:hypothetical protein